MGYKKMKQNLGFTPVPSAGATGQADFAFAGSMKHNRSLKNMGKLDKVIDWSRVESILLNHYTVGTSGEGADAYPPLLLFKCMLLQKWFHIDSDPELENQINDRWSFKKFLHLPLSKPSPNHSTFSRFRKKLPKKAMEQINSEILRQFENQGLSINEGIAVDARLVKSASRPVSNDELKKLREKRHTPEGYAGKSNRDFLSLNKIADGIMRKDLTTAKFTLLNMFEEHLLCNLTGRAEYEKEQNKKISKVGHCIRRDVDSSL